MGISPKSRWPIIILKDIYHKLLGKFRLILKIDVALKFSRIANNPSVCHHSNGYIN